MSDFNQRLDFTVSPKALAQQTIPTHLLLSSHLRESHTFELYTSVITARGVTAQFLPFECDVTDIARLHSLIEVLRASSSLRTIMVSDPFKFVAAQFADELTGVARDSGVVNLLQNVSGRIVGQNLDGAAFNVGTRDVENFELSGKSVVFFGCGGVSTAVSLQNVATVSRIALCDTLAEKQKTLARLLSDKRPELAIEFFPVASPRDFSSYDVLYNGTGLGKAPHEHESPLDERDRIGGCLIDAIYTPSQTRFLERGSRENAQTINGLSHMLASTTLHCSIICDEEIRIDEVLTAYRSLHAGS